MNPTPIAGSFVRRIAFVAAILPAALVSGEPFQPALGQAPPEGPAGQEAFSVPILPPGTYNRTLERTGAPRIQYAISIPPGYSPSEETPLVLALHFGDIPVAGRPPDSPDAWRLPVFAVHSRIDEVAPFGPTENRIRELQARGVTAELVALSSVGHYEADRHVDGLRRAVPWLLELWRRD